MHSKAASKNKKEALKKAIKLNDHLGKWIQNDHKTTKPESQLQSTGQQKVIITPDFEPITS